jgi:holo-[acyl-carrier protein] synthase
MILGYGIDAIEIERFAHWQKYSNEKLLKIFCQEEIDYCLANLAKSPERLAGRFAAKEAAYKAICSITDINIPFLEFCKFVYIEKKENSAPSLRIIISHLTNLNAYDLLDSMQIKLSITHTKTVAIASIIIFK